MGDQPLLHTLLGSKKLFKKDRCVAVLFQYNVKLLVKTIIHPPPAIASNNKGEVENNKTISNSLYIKIG